MQEERKIQEKMWDEYIMPFYEDLASAIIKCLLNEFKNACDYKGNNAYSIVKFSRTIRLTYSFIDTYLFEVYTMGNVDGNLLKEYLKKYEKEHRIYELN